MRAAAVSTSSNCRMQRPCISAPTTPTSSSKRKRCLPNSTSARAPSSEFRKTKKVKTTMQSTLRQPRVAFGWIVFLLIAVVGLFYVKWFPYYNRAFVAASQHSIGKSILMGTSSSAPAASWQAAIDYALAYGKAIWQAMVLGLLLGSAVQALLPAEWVLRWLGRAGGGSVLRGAVLAVPGMMCTCCAAPVVVGLRKANASAGAAIAFWLGNSVLNPATLVFIGFVLGWQWTALRFALGIAAVFGLGLAASRMS